MRSKIYCDYWKTDNEGNEVFLTKRSDGGIFNVKVSADKIATVLVFYLVSSIYR